MFSIDIPVNRNFVTVTIFLRGTLLFLCLALYSLAGAESSPYMPLKEVKVGMEGTWDTVIEGDELRTFHLKVLGVMPNFVGPRKPVIICEAMDPEQILSGSVAGMSGSPVYIDGRLVGAYAYGFTWPKEQTIIGVTPIESMMEIMDRFPPADISKRYRKSYNNGTQGLVEHAYQQRQEKPGEATFKTSMQSLSSSSILQSKLPFPLFVSGISPEVLQAFDTESKQLGVNWTLLPASTTGDMQMDWTEEQSHNLLPGMPVAGVLMGGDFSITGVGTVTWKQGNRILGFGHPFFGAGDVEIPMASARVVAVVRSLESSFKLSQVGPVIGSIYQDRQTGIAGEIGREAPTTEMSYSISNADGETTTYHANVFEHPRLSSLLMAVGLLQSLSASLDANEEQTIYLQTRIGIKDHAPVSYENVAVDATGARQLAIQLLQVMGALTNNPFEYPKIESLHCEVKLTPVQHFSFFDEVTIESDVPAPGETLDVNIKIRNYLGEPANHALSIPIPIGTKEQVLTLQIADANQVEPGDNALIRPDMDTLSDIIRQVNHIRSSRKIYIRLLKEAQGVRLQGDTMYDLPPSVTHLFNTPKNAQYSSETNEVALWETEIETDGVFVGSYRLSIEIK